MKDNNKIENESENGGDDKKFDEPVIQPDEVLKETSAVEESAEMKKKKKKKKHRALKIIICVVCVLVVLVTMCISYLQGLIGGQSVFADDFSSSKKYQKLYRKYNLYSDLDANSEFANTNVVNILMFGLDRNESREDEYEVFRPDTIILVSVNLETCEISLLSIPRDSYVYIYGRGGKDKINTCFYYGYLEADSEDPDVIFQSGVETLVGTVSELLGGIPINYYVGVDMDGAVDIIDYIGGVKVDVHTDIVVQQYNIPAGEQVLDGRNFLVYATYRQYERGDIDRVSVQQRLLVDLFDTVKEISVIKIPGLVGRVYDMLETNISLRQALALGMTLINDFSSENISMQTMPGNFGNYYGISYWIIDQSARVDLVSDMFGITISPDAQDERYKTNTTTTETEPVPEDTTGQDGSETTEPEPDETDPDTTPDEPSEELPNEGNGSEETQ